MKTTTTTTSTAIQTAAAALATWEADAAYAAASAADLLAALETLVNLHDGEIIGGQGITESDWVDARAAVAKAKGQL